MLQQDDVVNLSDRQAVQVDLDRALMVAFCRALDASRLPPMTVMSAMAASFGSVYRQVADTHQDQQCPCGWHPTPATDVVSLQSAFRVAATPQPTDQLLMMRVVGRA